MIRLKQKYGPIEIPDSKDLAQLYRPTIAGSSEQVTTCVKHIENMIKNGEIAPGQRLTESELTERFGVARGRVREALRLLAGDGVLELIPQKGARLIKLEPGAMVSVIEVLASLATTGVELFGARFHRPTGKVADAIRQAFERVDKSRDGEVLDVVRNTIEFHVLINHLSGNKILNHLISKMGVSLYERRLGDFVDEQGKLQIVEHYRSAAELILAGQATSAAQLLRSNVVALTYKLKSSGHYP